MIDKEVNLYEEHLKLNPRDIWCLNNMGAALMQLGQHNRAQLFFKKAIELDKNDRVITKNYRKVIRIRKRIQPVRASISPSGKTVS